MTSLHAARKVTAALMIGAFALTACGGGTVTSAPSTAAATSSPPSIVASTPPSSAGPTAAPATQAGLPEPCSDEPGCQVPAGTYHASRFDGGMTFRLHGETWTQVAYVPEMLSFQMKDEWAVFMNGPVTIRTGANRTETTSDTRAARKLLGELPGITVTRIDETVLIDGMEAVLFDVVNTGRDTTTLWFMGTTSAMYSLDPDVSVRMHWVDRAGTPFILALEAPTTSFEAFLDDSTVIIESIAFD